MLAYAVAIREVDRYFVSGSPDAFTASPDRDHAARFDSFEEARALARSLPVAAVPVLHSDAPARCGHGDRFRNRYGMCSHSTTRGVGGECGSWS